MELNRDTVRRLGSSKFNYWFGYVANASLVIWLTSHAWKNGALALSPAALISCCAIGLLSWTLSEYLLHRYVYHIWSSFLSTGHDLHHQDPKALIGVPWYLTTLVIVLLYEGLARLGNPAIVGVIMGFNWLGYIGYCLAHHGSHHWRFSTPWLRQIKKHHLLHHAYPDTNWGFTTSLWDVVFRTHRSRGTANAARADLANRPGQGSPS